MTTRYLRGDVVDQLLARTDAGIAYWELGDRLGSIRTVLDNSAVIKDTVTYDGWGNATHSNSNFAGRYLWTGREWDSEIGLQYNRARFYDPGSGRWISQDPMGFEAGDSNLYRYVNNRLTVSTDPSGFKDTVSVTFRFKGKFTATHPVKDKQYDLGVLMGEDTLAFGFEATISTLDTAIANVKISQSIYLLDAWGFQDPKGKAKEYWKYFVVNAQSKDKSGTDLTEAEWKQEKKDFNAGNVTFFDDSMINKTVGKGLSPSVPYSFSILSPTTISYWDAPGFGVLGKGLPANVKATEKDPLIPAIVERRMWVKVKAELCGESTEKGFAIFLWANTQDGKWHTKPDSPDWFKLYKNQP